MHKENFKLVLDHINANLETWDQDECYHSSCGTKHCFAGWAQILSGKEADIEFARRDARQFLQLTGREANYIFDEKTTMKDLEEILQTFQYNLNDDYDENGFDEDGLDINFNTRS